jgi:hypothetical protein
VTKQEIDHTLSRLVNYGKVAEGTNVPPLSTGSVRVPAVSRLEASFVGVRDSFNEYLVQWLDPEGFSGSISHYEIWVTMQNRTEAPQGPYIAQRSPAFIILPKTFAPRPFVVFHVLTVLKNGMIMPFDKAPTTTEIVTSSSPTTVPVDPGSTIPPDPNTPSIISFTASSSTVRFGQNVVLYYTVSANTTSADIDGNPIALPSGQYITAVNNTHTFTLTARNGAATATATKTVYVLNSRITLLNLNVLRYVSTPPSW